jgi:serine/threonine protein phosphatase PrpC
VSADPIPPAAADRIIRDANMETPSTEDFPSGSVAAFSRRSREKESANEDSAVTIPLGNRGVILAVADGVGGMPQGERASQLALETLVESVAKVKLMAGIEGSRQMRSTILDAIEKSNRRILDQCGGAATTLAIAQIIDNRLRTYHVGDSEVIIVGGKGMLKSQTLAHAPVAYGVHCGLIDPVAALVHESRNLVSNIVGDRDMRIEISTSRKLAPRDVVLLCSDGITDNLTVEQIADGISGKPTPDAAQAILEGLRNRREQFGDLVFKEDDATFLIYRRRRAKRAKPVASSPPESQPESIPPPDAGPRDPLETTA